MTPQMQLLRDIVIDATQCTPYLVREKDDGFDLTLDLANAQRRTAFGQAKLRRVVIYDVRPKDADYTTTDVVKAWCLGFAAVGIVGAVMTVVALVGALALGKF